MSEEKLKEEHREKHGNKLDSFSIGTAAKGGAVKVYYDMANTSHEDLQALIKKALETWSYAKKLQE